MADQEQHQQQDRSGPSIEGLATLLVQALDDTGTQWGCVFTRESLSLGHALLVIDRSTSAAPVRHGLASAQGTTSVASDAPLCARVADELLSAAFDRTQPVFANRVSHDSLAGLPADCPSIHAFAILPCQCAGSTAAVMVLINPAEPFASPLINRLQTRMGVDEPAVGAASTVTVTDDLSIHFQPQWRMGSGALYGLEALARWNGHTDAASTLAHLREFDTAGKLAEASDRLLDLALQHWAGWNRQCLIPDNVNLAVNIDASELLLPGFVTRVDRALSQHAVPAERLMLEIDENTWSEPRVAPLLDALKHLGVKLAVDGFGKGQSGLNVLACLPVDQIKLCPEMLCELNAPGNTKRAGRTVVSGIVELARSLVLPIVAVGVQSAAMHDALSELGFTAAQGYVIAPPLPAADITQLLEQLDIQGSITGERLPGTFINLADERPVDDAHPRTGLLLSAPA